MATWFILPIALGACVVLTVASCWGIYALTKQRWVWLLAPVFLVFWLAVGILPLSMIAYSSTVRVATTPAIGTPTIVVEKPALAAQPREPVEAVRPVEKLQDASGQ